jgi:hypothetical protein
LGNTKKQPGGVVSAHSMTTSTKRVCTTNGSNPATPIGSPTPAADTTDGMPSDCDLADLTVAEDMLED